MRPSSTRRRGMKQAWSDERAHRQHREHPANDGSDPSLGSCHEEPISMSISALFHRNDRRKGEVTRRGKTRSCSECRKTGLGQHS